MARSKKRDIKVRKEPEGNRIKLGARPSDRQIIAKENPDAFYNERPCWAFCSRDKEKWTFSEEHIGSNVWKDVLEKLTLFETQTWQDILLHSNNKNHPIKFECLNDCAQKRLSKTHPDLEEVISLRLEGTHRLYGFLVGRAYHIIWY